ncbi:S1 RNA-binding domain-containing protein [Virgibacillus halophilus]|uniref:S1 RNA-binding domain-containing protein n=1 Tax=Tigheibacillus halophilus TaxID=361280 RepID=A0ABU5C7R9_9BACI|nr:S1 RNA-binding domain-containing protein [Virgibacillus halophilus]
METLPIGTVQVMTVNRTTDHGYVLMSEGKEALLHHNETTGDISVGDTIKTFLYMDKKRKHLCFDAVARCDH